MRSNRVGAGADVVEVGDGEAALARAGEAFDCILLDHRLPGPSGLEVLRALRARGAIAPVVILTGSGDEEVAVAMMKAGASDYVIKGTLTADALWSRIHHAIQLGRAAQFEQQILGIVSHDLRNPISAVVMNAEMLARRNDLDDATKRAVRRILSSGTKANRMLCDLLDFTRSRIGAGLAIEPRAADLHAITRDTIDELRAGHPDAAIVHAVTGDGACHCDPDRVAQIVGNLVVNALTYGRAGAAVTVTTGGDALCAELAVHSEGDPIPPEIAATIFDPFARGSAASTSRRSLGLGLYIVRQLARAHGGAVDLRSTAAEGTTFRVRLPRRPPDHSS